MSEKLIDNDFKKLIKPESEQQKNINEYTEAQRKLLFLIEDCQERAETGRTSTTDDYGRTLSVGLETQWQDEHKMYKGDHWNTSHVNRSVTTMKKRQNSVDNFVFNTIENVVSNIAANTPDAKIESIDDNEIDNQQDMQQPEQQAMQLQQQDMAEVKPIIPNMTRTEVSKRLTFMSKFNDKRNKFKAKWKRIVGEFIKHGPAIAAVIWDNDWIGGRGPERWIGDIKIVVVKKEEFYPDPAIVDLGERLQECSFINRKFRKKLSYIKNRWKDGKFVAEEDNERDIYQDEGQSHEQTWLVEHWHRGKPKFMPANRRNELLELSEKYKDIDEYKSQEYADMAEGKLDGIHLAYAANGIFLEYIPYIYDHGRYPFVFKCRYYDQDNQMGFGEIKNITIPQILHNKADELEMDAFSRQGLGQEFYQKGSLSPTQKRAILDNSSKGGMMFEVDNINQILPRQNVTSPASLVNYKEHKQRMIETISSVTPIQQGMSPSANMPYKAIAELGARTDIRTKSASDILEDFLVEVNELRIELFAQFYTHDRWYRVKSEDGKMNTGNFNNTMMMFAWERDGKSEIFVPEFEVNVKIMDEKPTDRNYWTTTAFELQNRQIFLPEHVLYTLEEGKIPPLEKVLEDIKAQQQAMQEANMQKMQLEAQQIQHKMKMEEEKLNLEKMKIIQDGQQKQVENTFRQQDTDLNKQNMQESNKMKQQEMQMNQGQQQEETKDYDGFMQQLEQDFPEFIQMLGQIPEEQQSEILESLMNLNPEELEQTLLILSQTLQTLKNKGES